MNGWMDDGWMDGWMCILGLSFLPSIHLRRASIHTYTLPSSLHGSILPSIHLSFHSFVYVSFLPSIHPSNHPHHRSILPSIHLRRASIHTSILPSSLQGYTIYPYTLYFHPSIRPSIYMILPSSVYQWIYPSTPSIHRHNPSILPSKSSIHSPRNLAFFL